MSLIPAFEVGIWNAWILMIFLVLQTLAARLIAKDLYQKMDHPPDMTTNETDKKISTMATLLWFLATLYSVFLPLKLGTAWLYFGLAIFLPGLIVIVVASLNFAAAPLDKPVTQGIYRYSRHPMYLAIFLIYFSAGIASASWVFLLFSIAWLVLLPFAVVTEERYCLEKYGDAYRGYMNRTPRWVGVPR